MAGTDARLSPDRMARVLGRTGPGLLPRARGRSAGVSDSRSDEEALDVAVEGPFGTIPAAGWVPEQPGPPRPGPVGQLFGQGRHREVSTVRERLSTPVGLRGALVRPSARAVIGLALVVLLACGVVVFRVWRADAAAVPTEVTTRTASAPGALVSRTATTGALPGGPASGVPTGPAGASGAAAQTSAGPSGTPLITVHLVGAVRRPGVLRVPNGARVVEALESCGGATRGADLAAVNLARVLADGEQVVVPLVGRPGQTAGPARASAGASAAPSGSGGGTVNLNSADAQALDELPGIGPKIAERIIAWRIEHGRFSSVEELAEVSGIGDKLLSRLRPLVTL